MKATQEQILELARTLGGQVFPLAKPLRVERGDTVKIVVDIDLFGVAIDFLTFYCTCSGTFDATHGYLRPDGTLQVLSREEAAIAKSNYT
jgi:hypothetical protein